MRKSLIGLMMASAIGLSVASTAAYTQSPAPNRGYNSDAPTERERVAIENSLRGNGYSGWSSIERDGAYWDVDDARARNGGVFDLKLDRNTLRVVERKAESDYGMGQRDDRPPTERERVAIENSLRGNGYSGWSSIERDGAYWDVDDARARNGGVFDLKLDRNTLRVVERKAESGHGTGHRGDRPPTERERVAIGNALRGNGYTAWGSIERSGNVWEVDDARARNGATYDLKLDTNTLRVVERERDSSSRNVRALTSRERTAVQRVLRLNGFSSWKSIERVDGHYEVDDARNRRGAKFDLKLDTRMRIIERERDD